MTGLDLAERSVELARRNAALHGVGTAGFCVGDGEALPFPTGRFDVVYAHGVIQYAADPARLVAEAHRVLKPGGEAIFMVYNRYSWLSAMSKTDGRRARARRRPRACGPSSIPEYRRLLRGFASVRIVPERFPVPSRLHRGWKAALYNSVFVGLFDVLPRRLVRPLGWHLMALCRK